MFSKRLDTDVRSRTRQRTLSVLEWVIALSLLVGGMLACARIHADVDRADVDGVATEVPLSALASRLAEAAIDTQRHFTWLETEPDSTMPAFEEIVDGEMITTLAGTEFLITQRVDDYYWDSTTHRFSTAAPAGAAHADFKRLAVTVSWEEPRGYAVDVARQSDADPDGGSITLSTVILSSATTAQRLAAVSDL